jgi:hypothetical protein
MAGLVSRVASLIPCALVFVTDWLALGDATIAIEAPPMVDCLSSTSTP